MQTPNRLIAIAFALLALTLTAPAEAQGRHGGHWGGGWHGHGHWGPGPFWGGVGLGLGVGIGLGYYSPWYPGYPAYAVVPPVQYYPVAPEPSPPVAIAAPNPIYYPRAGQTPQQTEADRQDCNRWATTQQNAMTDASIFQRATLACMEGRGYTVK